MRVTKLRRADMRSNDAFQRQLVRQAVRGDVVAPSLIPVQPGHRIKTDRRDAKKLADLLRVELLTVVHPPTNKEEAVRDLCRHREDAKHDETRSTRNADSPTLVRRMSPSRRAATTETRNDRRFPE